MVQESTRIQITRIYFRFYALLIVFYAMYSCNLGSKKDVDIQNTRDFSTFNNDSAKNALLLEYYHGLADPRGKLIDTNWENGPVDFSDVFPLFVDNCTPCHSENGNGPFVLNSYEAILKRSAVIKDVLMERVMPPWMADDTYSELMNAPRINDSLRWVIVKWIDQGALPPKFSKDSRIQQFLPTKNLRGSRTYYTEEHTINSNDDSYQCFVVDLDLPIDTFVNSIRFHSSNPSTIHHIMVYMDTLGILNSLPGCWNCMKDEIVNKLIPIEPWSRGMVPTQLTKGFAFRYPKGSKLLLQTHYGDEGNKGQRERTSLQVFFSKRPEREIKWEILNNLEIFFPANTIKVETISFYTDSTISLIGCVPHLHFLAKKIEIFAITKELKKINILKINDWDYLWQGSYLLRKLTVIPGGSTIYMNAVYDNTANNPVQPNNPVQDVKYDTYSNQEMMVLSLMFTAYRKGDEQVEPTEILRK